MLELLPELLELAEPEIAGKLRSVGEFTSRWFRRLSRRSITVWMERRLSILRTGGRTLMAASHPTKSWRFSAPRPRSILQRKYQGTGSAPLCEQTTAVVRTARAESGVKIFPVKYKMVCRYLPARFRSARLMFLPRSAILMAARRDVGSTAASLTIEPNGARSNG